MHTAVVSVVFWSLQLCYGNMVAAKSTLEGFRCEAPGKSIYVVHTAGNMQKHIVCSVTQGPMTVYVTTVALQRQRCSSQAPQSA